MKPSVEGRRVAVIGSSSLLGKELLNVLEERGFPVSRLVTFDTEGEEAGLPIVDLSEYRQQIVAGEEVAQAEFDFVFVAARPRTLTEGLALLQQAEKSRCRVIDVCGALSVSPGATSGGVPRIPGLERALGARAGEWDSTIFVSPHPAAIILSRLLLALSTAFGVKTAVAQVLVPASELGPRGIEELQKQTVGLLSFQKIPQDIFGAQLGFSLLARQEGKRSEALTGLEARIRAELRQVLGDRAPLPALRLCLVPVFYSLALSLYVEAAQKVDPTSWASALAGAGMVVRRRSDAAPSPIEAAGSSEILVDAIAPDPAHPAGVWIWAVADNLRLAAANAVEIAESLPVR